MENGVKKAKKINKHFNISNRGMELLKAVQEEQGFETETATLEYILRMHNKEDGVYGGILNRIRIASQITDKNVQSIMEILNTILVTHYPEETYLFTLGQETSDVNHPLIEMAENHVRNKIAKAKQMKDNNAKKGKV